LDLVHISLDPSKKSQQPNIGSTSCLVLAGVYYSRRMVTSHTWLITSRDPKRSNSWPHYLWGDQCLNCRGVGGVEPPTVFSTPLTHCQIMFWGLLYSPHDLRHNFGRAPTVEKFNPPANFSQFKHWRWSHIYIDLSIGKQVLQLTHNMRLSFFVSSTVWIAHITSKDRRSRGSIWRCVAIAHYIRHWLQLSAFAVKRAFSTLC